MFPSLATAVGETASLLKKRKLRVVFAESCTAGLVSAALASVAGISAHLCGSAVTYRDQTKAVWLKVPSGLLSRAGAVDPSVTDLMATAVLFNTPEAQWSAAVTGHLGPDAPADLDGVIFTAIARRDEQQVRNATSTCRHQLSQSDRVSRQAEAATLVLRQLCMAIEATE
jgi:nicotinamide-nucleotide amidase